MRRGLIYGIGLWALLTLGFKAVVDGMIIGFSPDTLRVLLPLTGVFLALGIAFFLRVSYAPQEATRTGISLAIPGLILGAATLLAFGQLIAQPLMEHGIVYALFLLWTYGLLLTAVALFCDDVR
jgi:hypothetical protein